VKSHSVEENNNSIIDNVVQILSDIAVKHDVAIDVPNHVSKGGADPGNANRGRGASAMKDAARLLYTLTPMSPEEAQLEPRRCIRSLNLPSSMDSIRKLTCATSSLVSLATRSTGSVNCFLGRGTRSQINWRHKGRMFRVYIGISARPQEHRVLIQRLPWTWTSAPESWIR
jgi:hypothetical protein